jgi:hypothetical protein
MARATSKDKEGNPLGTSTRSDGTKDKYVIRKVVSVMEGRAKKIVFQLLELPDGRTQYRIGYYVLGKKGDMEGKWVWARSTPQLNPEDFAKLLAQAQQQGWYPAPGGA